MINSEEVKKAQIVFKKYMNGQLILMLLGIQLGRFLVCHQDRRKIETLDGRIRKYRNVLERDWPKNWHNQRNKENRSTRKCAVKLKE